MRKANLLVILDGFGYREETTNNAIALADTPTWDNLWQQHPHTLISGSGEDVGLPAGQMGNSEVGHMNLGAGRVIYQDYTRIDHAISQVAEVTNSYKISGSYDYLLKLVCTDVKSYNTLSDELIKQGIGIGKINTLIILDRTKDFSGYPLDSLVDL